MGSLGQMPDGKKLDTELVETPVKIGSILELLRSTYGLEIRRDSTLVMVNGVEVNVLGDLDAIVLAGDEVVLLPMFHGG